MQFSWGTWRRKAAKPRVSTRQLSLGTHLVGLVLAATLPLLVFTLALVARYVESERADIDTTLQVGAKGLASRLDREFETSLAALQALVESDVLDENNLARFYRTAQVLRGQRGWSNLVVLRPDGTQLLNLKQPLGSALPNLRARAYLQQVVATKRPFVSDLYLGSMASKWMVAIAVPVLKKDEVQDVVVAVIYAADMQSLVSQSFRPWTRTLVDRNGLVVARSGAPELVGRRAMPDFLREVSRSPAGNYSTTAADGVHRSGAFAHARLSGWTAAVSVPSAAVQRELWRSLLGPGAAGGAMLAVAVFLAWALGRRIAREISTATAAAEAVAQGSSNWTLNSRIAELWRLGAALETSAVLLEQRDQARAQAHARESQARREAEAANEAKDRFIATLSHELRTPLTPVLTALTLLQDQEELSPTGHDYVETIRRSVYLETRLIDDLLDVTRIVHGKLHFERHRVDLRAIIGRAIDVCHPELEARHIRLTAEYEPGPFLVEGDPARLQQVFWNVLKNAAKFTPEGGFISLSCKLESATVRIDITDEGVGIADSDLERIFEPFAQAEHDPVHPSAGLGLGLSISRAVIEGHGGSIRAFSAGEGQGATFSIWLPTIVHGALGLGSDEPQRTRLRGWRPARVLLVEDHPETARTTRTLLERAGHRVASAGDVHSALQQMSGGEFDILISDIGLPDGSGVDLMRALRERGNTVPGVAMSGYGSPDDVESTRSAGFVAHLVKPVDSRQLLRAIEDHARFTQTLNSPAKT